MLFHFEKESGNAFSSQAVSVVEKKNIFNILLRLMSILSGKATRLQ